MKDPTMSAEQPQTLEATWERLRKLTLRLDAHFEIHQKLEVGKQYASEHPIVTMMALLTLAFCSVPLICFIGFAVITFIFTFIGFLFVEGCLLTIATLVLGGVLCIVGFLSLGVGTFLALAWLSARAGHRLISQARSGQPMRTWSVMQQNGECVKDIGREKDN